MNISEAKSHQHVDMLFEVLQRRNYMTVKMWKNKVQNVIFLSASE